MSLLLDALRKSANQRHLGSAPGLEEGLRQQTPADPTRRSWLAPILMLLIVVAVVAARPWEQFLNSDDETPAVAEAVTETETPIPAQEPVAQAPVSQGDAPVATTAKVAPARPRPQPRVAPEPDSAVDDFREVEPDYADDAAYIAEQLYRAQLDPYDDSIAAEELEVDDQTGREVLKAILESADDSEEYREFISQIAADERGELETHPDFEELGIQYPQTGGASDQSEAQQLPGTADEPTEPRVVASSITAGGGGQAKAESAGRATARNSKPKPAPVEEEDDPDLGVVSFYELPVEVRSSMPAVNIQIRVYDEDPAKRFVISGTSRVHEGESLGDGVSLHKVRRDGLILVYQNYVFFWDKR